MLNFILAIVIGGVIGWLASLLMNRDASMGILWNIVVGAVGSFIGRILFGQFLGGGRLRDDAFDPMTLLSAFLGAVVLLGIVNLVQRKRIR